MSNCQMTRAVELHRCPLLSASCIVLITKCWGRSQVQSDNTMGAATLSGPPDGVCLCVVIWLCTVLTHPSFSHCLNLCVPLLSRSQFPSLSSWKLCITCGISVIGDTSSRSHVWGWNPKVRRAGGGGLLWDLNRGTVLVFHFFCRVQSSISLEHDPAPDSFLLQVSIIRRLEV